MGHPGRKLEPIIQCNPQSICAETDRRRGRAIGSKLGWAFLGRIEQTELTSLSSCRQYGRQSWATPISQPSRIPRRRRWGGQRGARRPGGLRLEGRRPGSERLCLSASGLSNPERPRRTGYSGAGAGPAGRRLRLRRQAAIVRLQAMQYRRQPQPAPVPAFQLPRKRAPVARSMRSKVPWFRRSSPIDRKQFVRRSFTAPDRTLGAEVGRPHFERGVSARILAYPQDLVVWEPDGRKRLAGNIADDHGLEHSVVQNAINSSAFTDCDGRALPARVNRAKGEAPAKDRFRPNVRA